eukprot:gene6220-1215_t
MRPRWPLLPLYMTIVWATEDDNVDDVKQIVRSFIRAFDNLEPRTGILEPGGSAM